MSLEYQNQNSKYIYSILDSLENKLGTYHGYNSYGSNGTINYKKNYIKNAKDLNNNENNEYNYIKKIVTNEFNQLILPYQKEFNSNFKSLESKINSINSKFDAINDINNKNNTRFYKNKEDEISKLEFIEMQNQISLMNSNISSLRNLFEKKDNENKKIYANNILINSNNNETNDKEKYMIDEINHIKKSLAQSINVNNMEPNYMLKEYNFKLNNIIQNYNSLKEENANFNNEINKIKEQINNENQKNINEINTIGINSDELLKLNNKIHSLESNIKEIEQNCNIKLMNLKNNLNNFDSVIIELKNNYLDNKNKSINSNLNSLNYDKKNQFIETSFKKELEELKNNNNKYFEELTLNFNTKNEEIFKLFEEHNVIIKNLDNKIEKIRNNLEIDSKKKFNHLTEKIEKSIVELNESNIGFNNESRNQLGINKINTDNLNLIKAQMNNQNTKLENFKNEIKQINENILSNSKRIDLLENYRKDDKRGARLEKSENDEISINKENNIISSKNNTNNKNMAEKKGEKNSKEMSKESVGSLESLIID